MKRKMTSAVGKGEIERCRTVMRLLQVLSISFLLGCFGCAPRRSVTFVFRNLSTNDISVEKIEGLSPQPPVGYLSSAAQTDGDRSLAKVSATFFQTVHVEDEVTIRWMEANERRDAVIRRKDVGLPANLEIDTVDCTYAGNGRWRWTVAR